MTTSQALADRVVTSSIELQKEAGKMSRLVRSIFLSLEKGLLAFLVTLPQPNVPWALGGVHHVLNDFEVELRGQLESRLNDLFLEQLEVEFRMLEEVAPMRNKVVGLFYEDLVMGATVAEWLEKIIHDMTFKIDAGVKTSLSNGDDLTGFAKLLKLSAEGSALAAALKAVDVLLRSAVIALSDKARKAIALGNSHLDFQWQQLSILDNRTTNICQRYAFRVWDKQFKPVGHKLPFVDGCPRHWGCRSHIVMIFDGNRLDDLTFEEWFEGKSATEQAKLFGSSRVKLWKAGKLSLSEMLKF